MSIGKRLKELSSVSLVMVFAASLVICSMLVAWFFKGLLIVKFGWLISIVAGLLVILYLAVIIRTALMLYRRYCQNKQAS